MEEIYLYYNNRLLINMYLVTCQYESDSERKRIEYVFSKYESGIGGIDKITGTSRIVSDEDAESIISDLYLRTAPENISLYKLSETDLKDKLGSREITIQLPGKKDTIESFVSYLLAQRKAIYKKSVNDNVKIYTSTTRKGYAEIKVGIHEKDGNVRISIEINAEEPNLSYLYEHFNKELNTFATSMKLE